MAHFNMVSNALVTDGSSQGSFYSKPCFMIINTIYKLMTSRFFFPASLLS